MKDLKLDISYCRTWGGPVYNLKTKGKFLRIMKDKEVIHAQTINCKRDWGLKPIHEILANIDSYVTFCESNRPFKKFLYETDEWSRHTKIYLYEEYVTPNGKSDSWKLFFESYSGEMSSYAADRYMDEFLMFVYNVNTKNELDEYENKNSIKFNSLKELAQFYNEQVIKVNKKLQD